MKSKILIISHILSLFILLSSCSNSKVESKRFVCGVINIAFASDDTLKKWQKQVVEHGDSSAFYKLTVFYDDEVNSNRKKEVIPYVQIMAEKHNKFDAYLLYYDYFKASDFEMTDTIKAIGYLKMASKEGNSLIGEFARLELANLYREGKYNIEKDSVIANYLDAGGCNIDSISQVRKKN